MTKLILDFKKLEIPEDHTKAMMSLAKDATGFSFHINRGEGKLGGQVYKMKSTDLASIVKSWFDDHPEIKLLLAIVKEIKI